MTNATTDAPVKEKRPAATAKGKRPGAVRSLPWIAASVKAPVARPWAEAPSDVSAGAPGRGIACTVATAPARVPAPDSTPMPSGAPSKMAVYGLNLYYKDFHALKNIDLEFPTNQVTALIGPSGCGKSTLLKSLNRMNDLVEGCRIEGRITLDGVDAYRSVDVNNLRRRVGMVFQQPIRFP